MIDLIDGYKIQVLDNCYAVGKYHKEKNKKTGETKTVFNRFGYYSSVQKALKNARRHMILDTLESFDGTLLEAIAAIRSLDERFEELLSKVDF